MRLLLIQPYEKPLIGKRKEHGSIMPPISLLTLASVVREKHPSVEVEIADFEARNGELEPNYADYDMFLITGTSAHMPHVGELLSEIHSQNPEACIILGGPHATFEHSEILRDRPEVDAVFRGEGEISLASFVKDYKGRASLPRIEGVSTRDYLSENFGPIVQNLDTLPELAYDLVDLGKYQLSTHRKDLPLPFVSLMTSRGCPFSCSYCQSPKMFGHKVRSYSAERVAEEIGNLKESYDLRSVVFWDDTFTANEKRVLELCGHIGKYELQWMCNTRVECVSRDLLIQMKEAGCRIIFYGVETSHIDTMKAINRNLTLDSIRNAFEVTRSIGIETVGTLMIGAPGDDLGRIDDNIEFLKSLKPDYVYISIYNVTPGADEYNHARKLGLIPEHIDWFNRKTFHGAPFGLPTLRGKLTRHYLSEAQKHAYGKFYGREDENE